MDGLTRRDALLLLVALSACRRRSSRQGPSHGDGGGTMILDAGGSPLLRARMQSDLDGLVSKNGGRGGGILRVESWGEKDEVLVEVTSGGLARGDRPIEIGDAFEVASITKTFTAAAILLLVEEGKVALDGPIGELLPGDGVAGLVVVEGKDYGPRLTLRQLLAHRSGLADHWSDPPRGGRANAVKKNALVPNAFVSTFLRDPDRMWEPAEILPFVRGLRPAGLPGEQYHYSDAGYVLLGLVAEKLGGAPLHAVFRERFLRPLGLTDTFLSYREQPPAQLWVSHRYESKLDLHGQRRQSADWASGGLVSTTRDLGRFLRALAGGAIFKSPSTLDLMKSWLPTGERGIDYGLGLFRIRLEGGLGEVWGHDGHGNSFMFFCPSQKTAWLGTLNQTKNDWWSLVEAGTKVLAPP